MDERGKLLVEYGADDTRQPYVDAFDMRTHGAGLRPVPEDGPDAAGSPATCGSSTRSGRL